MSNAEQRRLQEADAGGVPWRRWGPSPWNERESQPAEPQSAEAPR